MTPDEYTGTLINSGTLYDLYENRLDRLSEAKDLFKEAVYPAKIQLRGKRFVLLRTHRYHETERGVRYEDILIELNTNKHSIQLCGRKYGKGRFEYLFSFNDRANLVNFIKEETAHNPRKIVRTLRRIDTVIQWYNRRREGLLRAAEETMRQQSKWMEQLKNEVTMSSLQDD